MQHGWLRFVALTFLAGPYSGAMALQTSGCEPRWLPTFGGYPGIANGYVIDMVTFDDGSGPALYVAGSFETTGGTSARNVAKWDGSAWEALGSGVGLYATCLAVFDDGSGDGPALYAGGYFTEAGGAPANHIARWDGSTWTPLGLGTDGLVSALGVFDDGSGGGPALYAGGRFETAGGIVAPLVARWDGSSWSAVGGGMDGGSTASVGAFAVYDDGSGSGPALYVGGSFTSAGGIQAESIAKWDGSAWTPVGGGTDASIHAFAVHDEGTGHGPCLYAGGSFTQAGGIGANRIARWDGASWSALGDGRNASVHALTVFDDGWNGPQLHAAGQFTDPAGDGIARWDGASWIAIDSGIGENDARASAMSVFDDGSGGTPLLYVGGQFSTAGGTTAVNIARWDGGVWSSLTNGLRYTTGDVVIFDDGTGGGPALYAAGNFPSDGVARWNDPSWQPIGGSMNQYVASLEVYDDGSGNGAELYAAGFFTMAGGVPANCIARWNGASWSPLGSGLNEAVWDLCVFDDGSGPALYAAGLFTMAGGVPASYVAKWDGTSWSALTTGADDWVQCLSVHEFDGRESLYAGGRFHHAGGVPAYCIARWDGEIWRAVGVGTGGPVYALASFDDGSGSALYVGGDFGGAGSVPASHIAKWDGSSWSPLGSGTNDRVSALIAHDDGSGSAPFLYVGGLFTEAGRQPFQYMARWDGASWSSLGSGWLFGASSFTSVDKSLDGRPALFASGAILTSPGGDSFITRWGCPVEVGSAYCFCDGSGAPAPCGNEGAPGQGCANSNGEGAQLSAQGSSSVGADDLSFEASGLLAAQPALLFSADGEVNGGSGAPFGDGLRCAGGHARRLGIELPDAAGTATWGPALSRLESFEPGDTRRFQVWYRDPTGSPCGSGFNLSNGYAVSFGR